ncbi:hypothetical protein [Nonomuraea sp. NPDC046570]
MTGGITRAVLHCSHAGSSAFTILDLQPRRLADAYRRGSTYANGRSMIR